MVIAPPNSLPLVDTLWAFVSVDGKTGNEGICAQIMPGIGVVPMVTADETRLAGLKQNARVLAHESGMVIRLVRLTSRAEVEVFEP